MTKYQEMERQFLECSAPCDLVPPRCCDCSACPVRELCEWLCTNDPNNK